MNAEPSRNTQAVLLLTAPLLTGSSTPRAPVLTAREYRDVTVWLQSVGREPSDLLQGESGRLADGMVAPIDAERLQCLLDRGFQLAQALERWSARAIGVVGRADPSYPAGVKERLKANAPALLYWCGAAEITRRPALAIVGSRNAGDEVLEYTGEVAADAVRDGRAVVSGGARGVDRAAMNGALEAGGAAIGVLAGDLERTCMNRTHRNLILEERLLLVSPYDPLARFHVGQAMQRNKLIYAMADAGVVMDTAIDQGGTWAGAVEQLSKYGTPVYVRAVGTPSPGLEALRSKGALPWESADLIPSRATALSAAKTASPAQSDLLTDAAGGHATHKPAPPAGDDPAPPPEAAPSETESGYAEMLYQTGRQLAVGICAKPKSRDAIAAELGIPKTLADQWIKRLVAEKALARKTYPVRYVATQRDLFA